MMSKNNLYVAMACAILAFTGCTEDDMPGGNTKPAHPGEEIIFGGTLDSKATRTVYGDKHVDDKYTEVKWVAGDGVRIYCAEALYQDAEFNDIMLPGSTEAAPLYQKYCEYTVTDGVTDLGSVIDGEKQDTHSTGLKPSGEGYGLRWGSNDTHKFYAVYPSKTQLTGKDEEAANTLKLEGKTLTAQLPNMQGATDANYSTYITDNGNVTYYPAMRYAYMTAYKQSEPVSNLSLTFEPVVTAVEITLQNNTKIMQNGTATNQDLEVEMITLSHPTAALCGTFTANLETKVVTNANADASFKTVSVPTKMKSADGGTEKGNLLLEYGKTVTVTAFMALDNNASLEQIKVSILANGQLKTATLESTTDGVQIVQAKKKNFISTVNIGYTTEVAVDYSHWVRDLADVAPATPLGALSIPGAGGATSSTLTSNPASQEQTLTIDELWAQGVRCFEFTVDKGNQTADTEAYAATFGAQNVYCNFLNTNVSLNDAVNAVVQNITPDEFGMIIITYQEQTAGNTRNASDNGFGGNFQRWWTNYTPTRTVVNEDGTTTTQTITKALYNSELKVSQAQGKIFCICRPNAIGADPGWYTGVADDNYDNNDEKTFWGSTTKQNASIYCSKTNVSHPILCVLGWGNNPDQWYARGFGTLHTASSSTVNDANAGLEGAANRPFYVGTEGIPELEDYDYAGKSNFAYKVTNMADVPYTWNSTLEGGVFFDGWIQDWKRVVPNASTKVAYGISDTTTPLTGTKGSTKYYYNWSPSEDEKWEDIESTLDMAIKKEGGYSLYLNSLCGFFVDGSIGLSYQPCPTFQRYTEKKVTGTGNIVKFDDKYRGQFSISLDGNAYFGTSEVGDGDYGPFAVNGGYQGNIAAYADWVNNKFYNLLLQKQANGELTGKSAGIVMMDRVSDNAEENEAGYYIPRIIISMNFSGVENTTLEAKTSVLEEGEPVLGRKNFKVTWDN